MREKRKLAHDRGKKMHAKPSLSPQAHTHTHNQAAPSRRLFVDRMQKHL